MEGQNLHSNPVTQKHHDRSVFLSLSLSYIYYVWFIISKYWISSIGIEFRDGFHLFQSYVSGFLWMEPIFNSLLDCWETVWNKENGILNLLCPRKSEPPLIDVDLFMLWNIFVFSVFLAINEGRFQFLSDAAQLASLSFYLLFKWFLHLFIC